MTRYYSSSSAEYLGTTREPECSTTASHRWLEAYIARGGTGARTPSEPLTCRGTVVWVWLHSGNGDSESTLCEVCMARKMAEGVRSSWRFGYDHALYRDEEGVWRLQDGAELV